MDNLTPSDLFSPSKARQQRAQAQDWAHIDSWLSYKYAGRTVPTFERNEQTLKVLRELSMANERADEERAMIERAEREALKELDEVNMHADDQRILDSIKASLTREGKQALLALASTAVQLNTPTPASESLAHALIQHTTTAQNLANQLAHIHTLQQYLEKQHSFLQEQLTELRTNPSFSAPSSLQRQTIDQTRQIKHLRAKTRECEDRLSALQVRTTTPNSKQVGSAEAIGEMLEQQQALDGLREMVEGVEKEVRMFMGLPADREAARKEVGRLEVRLDDARRRRDGLFEGLVAK